ncbi:MAG: nuclear transport factor 2 family protein [Gemmatimonadetes bacterium]|nr:nuclear transport factor 2 family protein [Gemmatimonadota bacterium]
MNAPEDFVRTYEAALATQDWAVVSPLIHEDASVTFSDGSVHRGKDAVRAAFERNFRAIESEEYRISSVHWLPRSQDFAAYQFDYEWRGIVRGQIMGGRGRGTCVLLRDGDAWQLVAEHLGAVSAPR